jgi:hypothetical protein
LVGLQPDIIATNAAGGFVNDGNGERKSLAGPERQVSGAPIEVILKAERSTGSAVCTFALCDGIWDRWA